jgi:hypothetical protein
LSIYYKCNLSAITHKLNVSGRMLIWIFFLFWYVELGPKVCPYLSATLYIVGIDQKSVKFVSKNRVSNCRLLQLYRNTLIELSYFFYFRSYSVAQRPIIKQARAKEGNSTHKQKKDKTRKLVIVACLLGNATVNGGFRIW